MNAIIFESDNRQKKFSLMAKTIILIGLSWFIVVLVAAISGSFETAVGERPQLMLMAVLSPVAVFGITYFNMKSFRDWVLALDIRILILMHSWRMVGTGFAVPFYVITHLIIYAQLKRAN